MKKSEITNSIKNKRVYLNKGELLEHWGNVILLIFIIGMILIVNIQSEMESGEFPTALIVLLGIGTAVIFHKSRSRRFEIWKLEVSEEEFKDACLATSKYLDWNLINNQKNFLKAIKGTGWQWDGIRVTAIRTEKEIYFNSMIEPSIRSNPLSFGWNRKNETEFRNQILKAINGEKVVEEAELFREKEEHKFWDKSEWTFKNLLKRIIGYVLAIPFIVLGIWMILSREIQGLFVGLAIIGFSLSYIYHDIKVIREKKKRKKPGYNRVMKGDQK